MHGVWGWLDAREAPPRARRRVASRTAGRGAVFFILLRLFRLGSSLTLRLGVEQILALLR